MSLALLLCVKVQWIFFSIFRCFNARRRAEKWLHKFMGNTTILQLFYCLLNKNIQYGVWMVWFIIHIWICCMPNCQPANIPTSLYIDCTCLSTHKRCVHIQKNENHSFIEAFFFRRSDSKSNNGQFALKCRSIFRFFLSVDSLYLTIVSPNFNALIFCLGIRLAL